MKTVADKHILP